jgi:hypothetical protein
VEGLSSKRAFSPTDINPRNVGLTEGRESGGSSNSGNNSGDANNSGKGVDRNDSSDGVINLIKNYKCAFFIITCCRAYIDHRWEISIERTSS